MSTPPPPKPPITLQQAIAAEIRHNVIGAVIFLTLIFLVVWGSHHGDKEVIDETGATLTVFGDAILFILITIEPIQQLRRRKANPNRRPAPPVVSPQGHPWLIGTNALFGLSGAAFVVVLLFSPGTGMLAYVILMSIFLLQFYRLILQLVFIGGKEGWARMRKWKLTHWTHQPDQTHPTEHTTNAG